MKVQNPQLTFTFLIKQLYCGQWLGKKHVISGGSDNNMFKITDKTTLEVFRFLLFETMS